ncbi:MCE family protein [Mycobacterium sp. AZCC_0083]|uniref:MCE family protein n=1 Tax=Mycobacterium sp. AZCC_0083 TaxID=2735882 RepID=UPI00160A8428|nr:MCE family protein [Mycobacterium sp. AZCC_0083]MBB5165328.1 virulence factor Mce-like protein [Mycobacterium sp. AZCC_0083]
MHRSPIPALATASCAALMVTACSFSGLNSLPLPGAIGRGPGAQTYHVQLANVGTLESNSPVMVNDVVVGSVGSMTVEGWHADVDVSVSPGAVVPANAIANVGQTSLLGSMHLSLDPPLGQPSTGRLAPGSTIALNRSSTYPSTEQTLSSLSTLVNAGGLGQIGDVIHNFNATLSGHQDDIRDLLRQLNDFVGLLDDQRDNILASMRSLDRLAGTFAAQRDSISRLVKDLPPALDVLIKQRPRLTHALQRLGVFSETAAAVVNEAQADLISDLKNVEPVLRSLADVGPDLDSALVAGTTYPFNQNMIDRYFRGDYVNLFAIIDLTIPRLKRSLLLGTRWGDENAKLVPAPGDPWYLDYTHDPLSAPLAPPPAAVVDDVTPSPDAGPRPLMPPVNGPLLPVAPPPLSTPVTVPSSDALTAMFPGPYQEAAAPNSAPTATGAGR